MKDVKKGNSRYLLNSALEKDLKKARFITKVLILYNPKYAGNAGSIVRTCNQMGYKVIIVGTYSNKWLKDMNRAAMVHKLPIPEPTIIPELTKKVIEIDLPWYALEIPQNYTGDTPLCNIYKFHPKENHILLVGSENTGLPDDVLNMSDVILSIPPNPSISVHCSINVSHAVAMAFGVFNCKLNMC